MVFDINKFLEFEGDTGPYLLYAYTRANSIIKKSKKKRRSVDFLVPEVPARQEVMLLKKLDEFGGIALAAFEKLSPNLVANYATSPVSVQPIKSN